jgi:hypothetical protein
MEISKRIRHEHAELRSLSQRILNQPDGDGERDADFKAYERQLREHLDIFETFFLKRLKEDAAAKSSAADLKSEHALVRKELKALHRGDKESHQWGAEFRRFTERFEQLCHRHDALVTQAEASGRSETLDRQYEETKSKRQRSFLAPASSRGTATAMVVGAAAAAGAAYVLSRYLNTGSGAGVSDRLRRRSSWNEESSRQQSAPELELGATGAPALDSEVSIEYPAPDTDGARTALDPDSAPSASKIVIS